MRESSARAGALFSILAGLVHAAWSFHWGLHGYRGELWGVPVGLALAAFGVVCLKARPSLVAVTGMQGVAAAMLTLDAVYLSHGFYEAPDMLDAPFALAGLVLSTRFLDAGRVATSFRPQRCRRVLLVGAIAAIASAVLTVKGVWLGVLVGTQKHAGDVLWFAIAQGWVALCQLVLVLGILRMRGLALLGGIAASLVAGGQAVVSATVLAPYLLPQSSVIATVGCALFSAVAWSIPLLTRREAAAYSRVRVGTSESSADEAAGDGTDALTEREPRLSRHVGVGR